MRYVKYIGPSHRRGITADDWKTVGINGETVWWEGRNGFAVPLEQFTDEQIKKAIDPDPFLVVVGEDEDPKTFNRDLTPAEAVSPTVDLNAAVLDSEPVEPSGAPKKK
ncbi:MAG: hypothetical protein ABW022_22015 [Actinoplanes sp.]